VLQYLQGLVDIVQVMNSHPALFPPLWVKQELEKNIPEVDYYFLSTHVFFSDKNFQK
jgi:hypothetical protein